MALWMGKRFFLWPGEFLVPFLIFVMFYFHGCPEVVDARTWQAKGRLLTIAIVHAGQRPGR